MWTIISDPVIDPANVVTVKFLTFHDYPYEQKSCVIYAGEHPYIGTSEKPLLTPMIT
jgi:hypothetical protein